MGLHTRRICPRSSEVLVVVVFTFAPGLLNTRHCEVQTPHHELAELGPLTSSSISHYAESELYDSWRKPRPVRNREG
jgi:hypothetical protein